MADVAARAVTAIAGARRAVQLYPPAHPSHAEAIAELEAAIGEATRDDPLVLNLHHGRLYRGSLPIPDDIPGLSSVAEMFESLAIESLVFDSAFGPGEAVALTEALSLRPTPDLDLAAELSARGVRSVVISLLARADVAHSDATDRDSRREQNRALFRRSVATVRRMLEQVSAGDLTAVTEARTLAEKLIPQVEQDAAAVLAMAAARKPSERQLYHSLNVMCYSLLLGYRLGLPIEGLSSLGTAALLHDIGKTAFDPDDPAQAETMYDEHTRIGAEMLQRLALDDVAPFLVAYEHHMYADGSGFPDRDEGYIAHPYSRIVTITDRFENLTSATPDTPALTLDRALVQILREAGHTLDPFFARLFASLIGPFPVGCVVRLSDQRVGVVSRSGEEDPLTPLVRIAFDSNGLEVTDGDEVDLASAEVRIVEIIKPDSLDVDVSEVL